MAKRGAASASRLIASEAIATSAMIERSLRRKVPRQPLSPAAASEGRRRRSSCAPAAVSSTLARRSEFGVRVPQRQASVFAAERELRLAPGADHDEGWGQLRQDARVARQALGLEAEAKGGPQRRLDTDPVGPRGGADLGRAQGAAEAPAELDHAVEQEGGPAPPATPPAASGLPPPRSPAQLPNIDESAPEQTRCCVNLARRGVPSRVTQMLPRPLAGFQRAQSLADACPALGGPAIALRPFL